MRCPQGLPGRSKALHAAPRTSLATAVHIRLPMKSGLTQTLQRFWYRVSLEKPGCRPA